MKTLIILTHPNLKNSKVHRRFFEELEKFPEKYEVRRLYDLYPDENININEEQRVLELFDKIVFQFPIYWYNCPPLLKKWFDEVLIYGWAYGKDFKFEGKSVALCLSTNGLFEDYQSTGKHKYTLAELTNSFDASFNYIKANYKSFYVFYGAQFHSSLEKLETEVGNYLNFIDNI